MAEAWESRRARSHGSGQRISDCSAAAEAPGVDLDAGHEDGLLTRRPVDGDEQLDVVRQAAQGLARRLA